MSHHQLKQKGSYNQILFQGLISIPPKTYHNDKSCVCFRFIKYNFDFQTSDNSSKYILFFSFLKSFCAGTLVETGYVDGKGLSLKDILVYWHSQGNVYIYLWYLSWMVTDNNKIAWQVLWQNLGHQGKSYHRR